MMIEEINKIREIISQKGEELNIKNIDQWCFDVLCIILGSDEFVLSFGKCKIEFEKETNDITLFDDAVSILINIGLMERRSNLLALTKKGIDYTCVRINEMVFEKCLSDDERKVCKYLIDVFYKMEIENWSYGPVIDGIRITPDSESINRATEIFKEVGLFRKGHTREISQLGLAYLKIVFSKDWQQGMIL